MSPRRPHPSSPMEEPSFAMGRTKMTVRAQRKFALKAHIPGSPDNNNVAITENPPERDNPPLAQPLISIVREPVNDLIDQMAFKSLHNHPKNKERKKNLKDVRIILKRISPPRVQASPLRSAESIAESALIVNLKQMKLRNRVLTRDWTDVMTVRARNAFRAKRSIPQQTSNNPSRRASETSTEDNRPLTYFANSKGVKNKRSDLMNVDSPLSKHGAPIPRSVGASTSKCGSKPKEVIRLNKTMDTNVSKSNSGGRTAESAVIQNLKQMKLRNRLISREWTGVAKARSTFRVKRGTTQQIYSPSRRTSETSTEDNRPLTYFANCKVMKYRRNDLMNSESPSSKPKKKTPIVTKITKKNITLKKNTRVKSKTRKSPARRQVMRPSCIEFETENRTRHSDIEPITSSMCGDSLADNIPNLNTILPEEAGNTSENCDLSVSVTSDVRERDISNLPIIKKSRHCSSMEFEDDFEERIAAQRKEPVTSPVIVPQNPLFEFLRCIFNGHEDPEVDNVDARSVRARLSEDASEQGYLSAASVLERNEDVTPDLSLARVQEWLTSQCAQQNQPVEPEFKVPVAPRRRNNKPTVRPPASLVGSTRSTLALPLSSKERLLRKHCTAWNYVKLSDIITDSYLIRSFCAECTRCLVMFKSDCIQRPSRLMSANSEADVYEFNSERDDDSQLDLLPYRHSRLDQNILTNINNNAMFVNISKQPNHVEKIKEIMTEKGKKVLKAAIIMRENINESLLPRNHIILAQAIAILIDCNAARIDNPRQVAPPSTSRGTAAAGSMAVPPVHVAVEPVQQPTTSCRQCLVNDIDMSPVMRTRTRQYETLESLSSTLPVEAPLQMSLKFFPSVEEFSESPVTYAFKMLRKYPGMSLCGVKPPEPFTPACYVALPQMNFNASSQYIHRMLKRWGAITQEHIAIRSLQDPKIQRSPLFEGLEVDLVKLYHTVQEEKGIEACQNNKEKWQVVARKMKLHCSSNKAYTKLENIYLKYLLDYNTLTSAERERKFQEVNMCWRAREAKAKARVQIPLWRQNYMRSGRPLGDDEELSHYEKVCSEAEECITSGRYCNYNGFKKLSQQVMNTFFPNTSDPTPEQVEEEYWGIVMSASAHVCVHAGSVEATEYGVGFTNDISEAYASHPWNLKRLSMSPKNLLHYLSPDLGVTSTTIHYGMLFSTSCWHMDPTSVPWIEYLHNGSPKIWYSVAADQSKQLRSAVEVICPFAVQNKDIWLPSDIVMIPPKMLRQYGVTVHRHVQHVGEYVIVYPNTYTACIDTGFTVSEGVYFAPHNWIKSIDRIFQNLRVNAEPSLFSMEKLLISISQNEDTPYLLLEEAYRLLVPILQAELAQRNHLANRNVELITPEIYLEQNRRASMTSWQIQNVGECAYCRCHLYLSKVVGLTEGQTSVCVRHGVHLFENAVKREMQISNVYCIMLVTNARIHEILEGVKLRLSRQAV